ncbi:hypothetical protein AAH994_06070 [Weeksellaceae bacterium A-14]
MAFNLASIANSAEGGAGGVVGGAASVGVGVATGNPVAVVSGAGEFLNNIVPSSWGGITGQISGLFSGGLSCLGSQAYTSSQFKKDMDGLKTKLGAVNDWYSLADLLTEMSQNVATCNALGWKSNCSKKNKDKFRDACQAIIDTYAKDQYFNVKSGYGAGKWHNETIKVNYIIYTPNAYALGQNLNPGAVTGGVSTTGTTTPPVYETDTAFPVSTGSTIGTISQPVRTAGNGSALEVALGALLGTSVGTSAGTSPTGTKTITNLQDLTTGVNATAVDWGVNGNFGDTSFSIGDNQQQKTYLMIGVAVLAMYFLSKKK